MLLLKKKGTRLCVCLQGEIDHCSATEIRSQLETALRDEDIKELYIDLSKVSFIDSSGIGMLIGRYKTMAAKGGTICAAGLQENVRRLYHIAGLHRIIPIVEQGGEHDNQ